MADIEALGDLEEDEIALVMTSSEEYTDVTMDILRENVEEKGLAGVYVTVNKPASTLMSHMEREGVSTGDIFFVDAISEETGTKGEEENGWWLP